MSIVQRLEMEIIENKNKLNDSLKKWDEDSALKRLPKQDQPTAVRAVVSAKRLTTLLIPKLKFKVDLSLEKPNDKKLLESVTEEWNAIKQKIQSTLLDFEVLETGKRAEYPTKEQKQRDVVMSKNIEKNLKSKKAALREAAFPFLEDGRGDMRREMGAKMRPRPKQSATGDSEPLSSDGKKVFDNVRSFKELLLKGREKEGTLSHIVEDVCPDDAASVKAHMQSLVASEAIGGDVLSREMLDEVRGFDVDEMDRRKAERNQRLAKSGEVRERRIQRIEKLATVEPELTRTALPSPLPIDGFLDSVETFPDEIQKMVAKETEALQDYYKSQVFLKKKPLSSRQGTLINMNKLKKEYKDERFDASDFHIRAPQSVLAEEHFRMKEHRVDNAVKRFFGTFSPKLEESERANHPDEEDVSFGEVE